MIPEQKTDWGDVAEVRPHTIDARAVVDPGAELGTDCTIGPYAVIGAGVRLGPGCYVYPHAVVSGPTIMGPDNIVHSFACLGGPPQDLRYHGEDTLLVVGRGNTFREHVTVNRGTTHGGGVTRLGDDNLLMAYCHVAHDCTIGNHNVLANFATLAGHATVEDHVVFGGMVAVGAFLRIGESAMLAAGAMVDREVPPFCLVGGDRARLKGINRVGLMRRGLSAESRREIRDVGRALREKGRPLKDILAQFESRAHLTPEATRMLVFLRGVSRGLIR